MTQRYYAIGDIHADNAWKLYEMKDVCERNDARAIFLGDIVDRGQELYQVIEYMTTMWFKGRIEAITVGNHDWKIYRALKGRDVKLGTEAQSTFDQFNDNPLARDRFINMIEQFGYMYYRLDNQFFVHGGMHSNFYTIPPVRFNDYYERNKNVPDGFNRYADVAFYNFTTGNRTADGFPERDMKWHSRIPRDVVVWKGHDALENKPVVYGNEQGGAVVYLDTGSGKNTGPLTYAEVIVGENHSQLHERQPNWIYR